MNGSGSDKPRLVRAASLLLVWLLTLACITLTAASTQDKQNDDAKASAPSAQKKSKTKSKAQKKASNSTDADAPKSGQEKPPLPNQVSASSEAKAPAGDQEAQTPPPGSTKAPDDQDKKFVKDAHIGNVAEIELGQMAQEKAASDDVKQFGARMVKDNSSADDKSKGVAQNQHIALPVKLDAPHKNAKARLSTLTGDKFDRAYMLVMVQEHSKTVQKFQREATASHDPTVKEFAAGTLPKLQDHLKEARHIQQKLGGKGQ